jgi:lipopolysaccharide/colanic/teichoic acid biosynthesis glycosyltransferase
MSSTQSVGSINDDQAVSGILLTSLDTELRRESWGIRLPGKRNLLKRLFDLAFASLGLVLGSVILAPTMLAVWLQDRHSPLYIADRIGRRGARFRIIKLRSMRILADSSGITSTATDDPRITAVGRFIRRAKLDELTQLWNVLLGDMSLVGPRPQVASGVELYSDVERSLLTVRPGITDLASIVFADEGDILDGAANPDARYDAIIRPWKSRLGLLYVHNRGGLTQDIRIIGLTALSAVNRRAALDRVAGLVAELGGDTTLQAIASRRVPLAVVPPPGTPGSDLHFTLRAR